MELKAVSVNKEVQLSWPSAGANQSYHVYIFDSASASFSRVSQNLITDTFFVDKKNYYTGNYTYAVAAAALETCASGSYLNVGAAAFAPVNHVNGLAGFRVEPKALIFPNPVQSSEPLTIQIAASNHPYIEVEYYDLSGKRLGSNRYMQNNPIEHKLQAGCYILKITAGTQHMQQRLVVY
jgi:hypothetical protein